MSENQNASYVIAAPPMPKQKLTVVNGGAHRGAFLNAPSFGEFNRLSKRAEIEVAYVDPQPGRAADMVKEAGRYGVTATAHEGRIEDVAGSIGTPQSPRILNLDKASALARVLSAPDAGTHPTLGYLLLKLPSGKLWAVRFVLTVEEKELREHAVKFFARVADASERGTSADVLGETADPAHVLAEPQIRAWFADHTKKNLAKIVAGVEPASAPFEVTLNGVDTLPLFIVVRDIWSDPTTLADEVLKDPSSPIRKGSQFMVAECTDQGLRFHAVRRRTDDRVTVGGVEVLDRSAVEAERRVQAGRAAAAQRTVEVRNAAIEALAKAVRETVSRRNPVTTTDLAGPDRDQDHELDHWPSWKPRSAQFLRCGAVRHRGSTQHP